jgi:type IX secretion system PorP/SprF family membrane protein
MVKRYIIIIGILIAGSFNSLNLKAQDPHFSQFYANPIYLNPALAGSETCPRVGLNYRNQWPGFGPTYATYSISYDQFVRPIHGGIGLSLIRDVEGSGAVISNMINAMYSYTLRVSPSFYLSGGFQFSYMTKKLNQDFVFPDMIDPLFGPIYSTSESNIETGKTNGHVDFSLGFVGYTENTFFGIACHHLAEPRESFYKNSNDAVLPRKFTVHFGTEFDLHTSRTRRGELKLSPQLIFQQQGKFQQFNWGLYLMRNQFIAGLWARQNFSFKYDAVVMLLGFKQDNLRFAYSYDLTVSELSRNALGSHEVSVAFTFGCYEKTKPLKAVKCPSF